MCDGEYNYEDGVMTVVRVRMLVAMTVIVCVEVCECECVSVSLCKYVCVDV